MAKQPVAKIDESAITTETPIEKIEAEVVSVPIVSYIASSESYPFFIGDRALPQEIDDAESQFGLDIYDKMAAEPVLGAAEAALKVLVLADGLSISPNVKSPPKTGATPEQVSDYEKSEYASDFIRHIVNRLGRTDRPILSTLWNLLEAIRKGHKIAEITYDYIEDGIYSGLFGVKSIRPKPHVNYSFVLDGQNNFRGVIAKVPGGSIALRTGIVYDVSLIPNAIAPEKLLILTLDDSDADPRGRSWYRRAYNSWLRKTALNQEEIKTATQFAGGMITAVAPDENQQTPVKDQITGQPVRLANAIATSLSQLRNGGFAVFPFGTLVTVHAPHADVQFFERAKAECDMEMVTTLVLTARSILEAKRSSKSDSDNAQDLLDELKQYVRRNICEVLTAKLFHPLLVMNFGKDFADNYTPIASMQRTSMPDFAANATGIAALMTSQYIDPSQLDGIDRDILGFPERADNSESAGDADIEEDAADQAAKFRKFQNEKRGTHRQRMAPVDEGRQRAASLSKFAARKKANIA